MKKPWRRFSAKLIISYGLVTLTAILAVSLIAFISSRRAIIANGKTIIHETLAQVRQNTVSKAEELRRIGKLVFYDELINNLGKNSYSLKTANEILTRYIRPRMQNILLIARDNLRLQIYIDNPDVPEIYYTDVNDVGERVDPLTRGQRFELLSLRRIGGPGWFKYITSFKQGFEFRRVEDDTDFGNISLIGGLYDLESFDQLGAIRLIVRMDDLFQAVNTLNMGSETMVQIISEDSVLYQSGSAIREEDYGRHLIVREPLEEIEMDIIAFVPHNRLVSQTRTVTRMIFLGSIICFLVLLLISVVVSRRFSSRISSIIGVLNSFRKHELQRRIDVAGNDEFSQIGEAFNEMADEIEELIHEVYISNIKKKEAELRILQAQINPHFLYNALSSLSKLVKLSRNESAHDMIMMLAKFYRVTLGNGQRVGPVHRELEQVRTYLDILQIMYMDDLSVCVVFDTDIDNLETAMFVIQPFIENSIAHGWGEGDLHLLIRGELGMDRLRYIIEDDGIGMDVETLASILLHRDDSTSYGVINVHDRIRLLYGKPYGVEVNSEPGSGTRVVISMPIKPFLPKTCEKAGSQSTNTH